MTHSLPAIEGVTVSEVVVGPPGPKGDTGAKGDTGPKGNTGAAGPAGPRGDPPYGEWLPMDSGFLCWTYDPGIVNANTVPTVANMYLSRVHLPRDSSVIGIATYLVVAGAGLTAGACFLCIYDATLARVAATADQSASFMGTPAAFKSPLSPGPVNLVAGLYHIGVYANGTTMPQFPRGTGTGLPNVNAPDGKPRYGVQGGCTGAPPATLSAMNPSSIGTWFAMY